MKIPFTVLLASLALVGKAQSVHNQVQKIRKECETINISTYDIKTYNYNNKCGVTNGTITIYYKNGTIKKITDIGIGDGDRAAAEWNYQYYYKSGSLIFSFETRRYFNNEKNKEEREETRQYFVANRLIKQIKNKETTFPGNVLINRSDIRYRLTLINKESDIGHLYKCKNE